VGIAIDVNQPQLHVASVSKSGTVLTVVLQILSPQNATAFKAYSAAIIHDRLAWAVIRPTSDLRSNFAVMSAAHNGYTDIGLDFKNGLLTDPLAQPDVVVDGSSASRVGCSLILSLLIPLILMIS